MNSAFRAAADQARQKPVKLTHNQQVCRLYRKSLKTLLSWCIDREIFNSEATEIRAQIDATRGLSQMETSKLLKEGQAKLAEYAHPDPYCVPHMPGGTLFMRNPPLPAEVCFPDGNVPADFPKVSLNPDWSISKPETGKSAIGSVLIDFPKKNME